ncbi:hypothetical protein CEXT_273341 [Caerostris extrusa]|uniref:Uncharacterized protein n=1 Tax=Caerostris extrusa TaxID=172846 RepID=A0AAV4S062_CAEEX|nr:hypothetical protein CEXT_273341 [Caerostris extrusa]
MCQRMAERGLCARLKDSPCQYDWFEYSGPRMWGVGSNPTSDSVWCLIHVERITYGTLPLKDTISHSQARLRYANINNHCLSRFLMTVAPSQNHRSVNILVLFE